MNRFKLTLILSCTLTLGLLAQVPSWWAGDGVDPNTAVIDSGAQENNQAVANIGQLKHIATRAKVHLDEKLMLTAADWDAAFAPETNPFPFVVSGQEYLVLNQGQLKFVSDAFYEVMESKGINTRFLLNQYMPTGEYWDDPRPWTAQGGDENHYAVANIGQLKFVFSFDLSDIEDYQDLDADSLLDSFEDQIVDADPNDSIVTILDVDPQGDYDADGISNEKEYQQGSDPTQHEILLPEPTYLTATDLGAQVSANSELVSYQWTVVSAPAGTVSIVDATAFQTKAYFEAAGTYTLQLDASFAGQTATQEYTVVASEGAVRLQFNEPGQVSPLRDEDQTLEKSDDGYTVGTTLTNPLPQRDHDEDQYVLEGGLVAASVSIGFTLDFMGQNFDRLFINNNGNLTFQDPLSAYEPVKIVDNSIPVIAPFWADVDTRPDYCEPVYYGYSTISGQNAVAVTWVNAGAYSHNFGKRNTFQVVIIDRSDVATGDFDLEFNYNRIEWDVGEVTGSTGARAGFSNGSNFWMEIPGSGEVGRFLNTHAEGLIKGSRGSATDGRYVYEYRNGQFVGAPTVGISAPPLPKELLLDELFKLESNSSDADLSPEALRYEWSLVGADYGANVLSPYTSNTRIEIFEDATYQFRLEVNDGEFGVSTDLTAAISRYNEPPQVSLSGVYTAADPDVDSDASAPITLIQGSATDPEGGDVQYEWTLNGLSIGTGSVSSGDDIKLENEEFPAGMNVLGLKVTDDQGNTDQAFVSVQVTTQELVIFPETDGSIEIDVGVSGTSGSPDPTNNTDWVYDNGKMKSVANDDSGYGWADNTSELTYTDVYIPPGAQGTYQVSFKARKVDTGNTHASDRAWFLPDGPSGVSPIVPVATANGDNSELSSWNATSSVNLEVGHHTMRVRVHGHGYDLDRFMLTTGTLPANGTTGSNTVSGTAKVQYTFNATTDLDLPPLITGFDSGDVITVSSLSQLATLTAQIADEAGSSLTYLWERVPELSDNDGYTLTDETTAQAKLSNYVEGHYTLRLTVSDPDFPFTISDSRLYHFRIEEAPVSTAAQNAAPTANAGADVVINNATPNTLYPVALDGSASSDTDGTIVRYSWTQGGIEQGTQSTLNLNLTLGIYEFTLEVEDNLGEMHTDTVLVQILDTAGLAQEGGDRDGDGMPDLWETHYGLLPTNAADASSDPDSDGLSNLQEYTYGSNPNVANSDLGDSPIQLGSVLYLTVSGQPTRIPAVVPDSTKQALQPVSYIDEFGYEMPYLDPATNEPYRDHNGVAYFDYPTPLAEFDFTQFDDYPSQFFDVTTQQIKTYSNIDYVQWPDPRELHVGGRPLYVPLSGEYAVDPASLTTVAQSTETIEDLAEVELGLDPAMHLDVFAQAPVRLAITAEEYLSAVSLTDADFDGVPDVFELGLGSLEEGGIPTSAEAADVNLDGFPDGWDSDADGLPDGWEAAYSLLPADLNDATNDLDGDGLDNLLEYQLDLAPNHYDSDGDGLFDDWEVSNPYAAQEPQGSEPDPRTLLSDLLVWYRFDLDSGYEGTLAYDSAAALRADYEGLASPSPFDVYQDGLYHGNLQLGNRSSDPLNIPEQHNRVLSFLPSAGSDNAAYLAVPSDATLGLQGSSFSISLLFKPEDDGVVADRQLLAKEGAYHLHYDVQNRAIRFGFWYNGTLYETTSNLNEVEWNQWNFICVRYDTATNQVDYRIAQRNINTIDLDDSSQGTGLSGVVPDTSSWPLLVGAARNVAHLVPSGDLDSIRFYGHALSTADLNLLSALELDDDKLNEPILNYNLEAHRDRDSDGLSDIIEAVAGLNPFSNDTNGNGILDNAEYDLNGTALYSDFDDDGLNDNEEPNPRQITVNGGSVMVSSLANDKDSDDDGLHDGTEFALGTNPQNVDTDGDGMEDLFEFQYSSDPVNGLDPTDNADPGLDPDGDGLTNLQEFLAGSNPLINETAIAEGFVDTDGDGLSDEDELNVYYSDPLAVSSVGDGISDGYRIVNGLWDAASLSGLSGAPLDSARQAFATHATFGTYANPDGDRWSNAAENRRGENPVDEEDPNEKVISLFGSQGLGKAATVTSKPTTYAGHFEEFGNTTRTVYFPEGATAELVSKRQDRNITLTSQLRILKSGASQKSVADHVFKGPKNAKVPYEELVDLVSSSSPVEDAYVHSGTFDVTDILKSMPRSEDDKVTFTIMREALKYELGEEEGAEEEELETVEKRELTSGAESYTDFDCETSLWPPCDWDETYGVARFREVGFGSAIARPQTPKAEDEDEDVEEQQPEPDPAQLPPLGNLLGSSEIALVIKYPQCASCSQCEWGEVDAASPGANKEGMVQLSINAGKSPSSREAQFITLKSDAMTPALATPAALKLPADEGMEVLSDAQGDLKQIRSATGLAQIVVVNAYKYQIDFYKEADVLAFDAGSGLYGVSGTPAKSVVVENPAASPTNYDDLLVTEYENGLAGKEALYAYNGTDTWTLKRGENVQSAAPLHSESLTVVDFGNGIKTETRVVYDTDGTTVLSKVRNTLKNFPWGDEVISQINDPDGEALTTSWSYYETLPAPLDSGSPANATEEEIYRDPLGEDASDGLGNPQLTGSDREAFGSYGQIERVVHPNGNWTLYAYDEHARITQQVSQYLSNAEPAAQTSISTAALTNRSTEWLYDLSSDGAEPAHSYTRVTRRIESVNGQEVSRTYTAENDTVEDGLEITETQRATLAGTVLDVSSHLISTTESREHGDRLLQSHADGTIEIRETIEADAPWVGSKHAPKALQGSLSTMLNDFTDGVIEIRMSGRPDAAGETIVDGSVTLVRRNLSGTVIQRETYDVASTLMTDFEAVTQLDDFGRATETLYLDGTTSSQSFGCCGVDSATNRQGVTTTFTYDALGRLETTTAQGVTRKNVYDGLGRIIERWRYPDDTVNPDPATDSLVSVEKTNYTLPGRIDSTEDALGHQTTYTLVHNVDGTTTRTSSRTYTDAIDGQQTALETDITHGDGSLKERSGNATRPLKLSYHTHSEGEYVKEIRIGDAGAETEWMETYTDLLGRNTTTKYADNSLETRYYNEKGQLQAVEDPDGVVTLFAYNQRGEQEVVAVDVDGDLPTASDAIDYAGTDRITRTKRFVIEASGRGEAVHRSSTEVWTQDNSDMPIETSVSDRSLDGLKSWQSSFGVTTSSTRSLQPDSSWLTQTLQPDGSRLDRVEVDGRISEVKAYDAAGGLLSSTTYAYDDLGRVGAATSSADGTTNYTYDKSDRVKTVTAPGSVATGNLVTTNVYDELGRLTLTILPDTTTTAYRYYADGQLRAVSGSQQYPVEFTYTPQGRRKTLETTTNAGPSTTTWNYDAQRGFLTSKQDNALQATSYAYTDAGRLETRTHARGTVTNYSYNTAGELTLVDYQDAGTTDVSTTYTRFGARDLVEEGTWNSGTQTMDGLIHSIDYAYNDNLRVASEDISYLSVQRLITRHYDALLRPSLLELGTSVDPDADHHIAYTYDNAGRLATVSDAYRQFTYAYDPTTGRLSTLSNPVHTTSWTYEGDRRLVTGLNNAVGATTVSNFAYTYNKLAQRTDMTTTGSAFSYTNPARFDYQYDAKGQLEDATRIDTVTTNQLGDQAFAFTFDDIGNRTQADRDGTLTSYTPDQLNQYNLVGANTVTHDLDGNRTQKGTETYSWNTENRLTQWAQGTNNESYTYDSLGRRTSKVRNENGVEAYCEIYIYDGWNLLATYEMTDVAPVVEYLSKTYTWGVDLSGSMQGAGGVGGLLGAHDVTTASLYTYTYDANGNVSELLDNTGAIAAHYEYGPFGELIVESETGLGSWDNPFQFSTKVTDETGLVYYGYRLFDAETGRWLNRDPIEERGGVNIYGFVRNNGANLIDVLGREPAESIWDVPAAGNEDIADSGVPEQIWNVPGNGEEDAVYWREGEITGDVVIPKMETLSFDFIWISEESMLSGLDYSVDRLVKWGVVFQREADGGVSMGSIAHLREDGTWEKTCFYRRVQPSQEEASTVRTAFGIWLPRKMQTTQDGCGPCQRIIEETLDFQTEADEGAPRPIETPRNAGPRKG